jgi:hypothetical protein
MTLINVKPTFGDLYGLAKQAEALLSMVSALADTEDTIQRASDLLGAARDFVRQVQNVVYVDDE